MATTWESRENIYGPNAASVESLAQRLSGIQWFSAVWNPSGRTQAEQQVQTFIQQFGLQADAFEWLSTTSLADCIARFDLASSPLWHQLSELPTQLKLQAEQKGRSQLLETAVDWTPEKVFHAAYEGAFPAFQENREALEYAVCTAMFVSGLAIGLELIADDTASNPLLALLPVFEMGYWPVGLFGGKFYLA